MSTLSAHPPKNRGSARALRERILSHVVIDANGCWLWQFKRDRAGYGVVKLGGKAFGAHRVSYKAFVGTIPRGLVIDHLCRVPRCVNPAHLEPVTQWENVVARSATSVSAICARKTYCSKDHPLAGVNVKKYRDGKRRCQACRREADARYLSKRNVGLNR